MRGQDLQVITDEQLKAYAANTDPLHGELALVAKELIEARKKIEQMEDDRKCEYQEDRA